MFKLLLSILFPAFCLNCKKFGKYICTNCRTHLLPFEKQICFYCEKESFLGLTHKECQKENGVDQFITIFHYNNVLKKIIAGIKYRLVSDAFGELFELINNSFPQTSFHRDISVQPIPLHTLRYRQRGFNQSELIAKWIAAKTGGVMTDYLVRTKETKPQAQLKKEDRVLNAQSAFALKKGQKQPNLSLVEVVLVDDVVTTGSTTASATAVLKAAGARKVTVFSIAKD